MTFYALNYNISMPLAKNQNILAPTCLSGLVVPQGKYYMYLSFTSHVFKLTRSSTREKLHVP